MGTSSYRSPAGFQRHRFHPDDLVPADLSHPPIDQESLNWQRRVMGTIDDHVVGAGRASLEPVIDTYRAEARVA